MIAVSIRLFLVAAAYIVSIFVAVYFGLLYDYLFPYATGGSFIGAPGTWGWIIGFPLAIIFTLTFLIHSHGGSHVWQWSVITASPAILFELAVDPLHIYLPAILGLIAWGLGYLANKTLTKLAPGVMAKMR